MQDKQTDTEMPEELDGGQGVSSGLTVSLRESREAHGLSVDDVSHRLHLDREVILALEAEDYESLGAPVFVRGYLRSYARLLGLPEDAAAATYQSREPEPEEFRTLSAQTVVKPGASLANFVLWVCVALVILAGAGYLLMGDPEPSTDGAGTTVDKGRFIDAPPVETEESLPEPEDIDASAEPEPLSDAAAGESSAEPMAEVEEPVIATATPAEPAPERTVRLGLTFTDECWIEIADAQARLLYGLEKAGRSVTLSGTPPLRFFIGNVDAVDIALDGVAFAVPAAALTGNNTARFTLTEDDLPEMAANE